MANILILSLVFPPDSVSTAQIIGDLATDLNQLGHQVTVLTTSPHYNHDEEAEARQPLRPYWGRLLRVSELKGVRAYHTAMPRKGSSLIVRLFAWSGFHFVSTLAGLVSIERPDIVMAPSPPLTIGLCARFLAWYYGVHYVYDVQELYPDVAINLGAISNKWLIAALLKLEAFVYQKARFITVIAPRMRERLLQKGVPDERIEVIPNFVDLERLQPMSKDNPFSRQHGIHDKFVVSYSGNMGPAQGLETFIEAADILKDDPHIHFMMMGSGILMASLQNRVRELSLRNFSFLSYQHNSLMPQIYAASDVCLVPLSTQIGSDAVPSKVYRIMACSRPVLACADHDSDLARLIQTANCGVVVEPGSAQTLADAIQHTRKHPELAQKMGNEGRQHVIEHYSRPAITGKFHRLIQQVVHGNSAHSG
jgi:putative colanic acid biosynthesis glycosyltransferase WcaI